MPHTVAGTGKRAKNKNRPGTSFHDAHSLVGTREQEDTEQEESPFPQK